MGQRRDFECRHDGPAFSGKGKFGKIQLRRFLQVCEGFLKGLSLSGCAGLGIVGNEPIAVGIGIYNRGEVERFFAHTVYNVYRISEFPAIQFWPISGRAAEDDSTEKLVANRIASVKTTSEQKERGGAFKGCLFMIVIIGLALIGGCLYFETRRPHFSGTSPLAIDVSVRYYDGGPNNYGMRDYALTITNRAACEAILREFQKARPVFGSEKGMGTFTFRYDNGEKDDVLILHGFPDGYYSISDGRMTFRMPIDEFRKTLNDAGVDASKFQGK